uniref:Aminomethyltransferase n=1 Tax=Culicoides sonorensis TaxID=179676 RepID=A0A336LTL8_CULSO
MLIRSLQRSYSPISIQLRRALATTSVLKAHEASKTSPEKTSLYDFHVKNKGKVVDFAGYLLPVQYDDLSISASHLHTRKNASVFDVSHMLQTYIRGKDAIACFESICTADLQGMQNGNGSLTVFTNPSGGILDDLIVSRVADDVLYVVSNAACKAQDKEIMKCAVDSFKSQGKSVDIEFLETSDRALLALQGPSAMTALQELTKIPLKDLFFMQTVVSEVAGTNECRITRCGYTGEDGFEISIPAEKSVHVAEALLNTESGNVKLAGLGARDSLRLEAGLCLYGSDIDTTTSPIEAALAWLVAKRRRAEANFPGAETVLKHLKDGCSRRRVGFRMTSGPPARHGTKIVVNGEDVGEITSGCPSPSLGGSVAMGYIKDEFKKVGTKVELKIRDKLFGSEVTKMPFVTSNYYQKPK